MSLRNAVPVADLMATLSGLRNDALRQFNDIQERASKSLRAAGFSAFSPLAAIKVTPDETGRLVTTLRLGLPGFNKSDIKVDIEERTVRISADHAEGHPLGLTGKVEFTCPLAVPVDAPNASCELKDGVLTVTLPSFAEVAKSVTIPVR